MQTKQGSISPWVTDYEPAQFEGSDHRICTRKVTMRLGWKGMQKRQCCRQGEEGSSRAGTLGGGGQHKEPDETVLTKVVGTVIVAVQSLVNPGPPDTQPASSHPLFDLGNW